jgi:hypothetical protein
MEISDQATCLDPYFASFEESLSSRNYKPETLKNYRYLLRRFGRLLDCADDGGRVGGVRPARLHGAEQRDWLDRETAGPEGEGIPRGLDRLGRVRQPETCCIQRHRLGSAIQHGHVRASTRYLRRAAPELDA